MHTTRSFVHVLTLMFVFFKITNYLDWSWFGIFGVMIFWYLFALLGAILDVAADRIKDQQKRAAAMDKSVSERLKAMSRNN